MAIQKEGPVAAEPYNEASQSHSRRTNLVLGPMQESVSQKNLVPNRRSLEKSQVSQPLDSSRVRPVGVQGQPGQPGQESHPPRPVAEQNPVYGQKDVVASQPHPQARDSFAREQYKGVRHTNVLMGQMEESVNDQGMIAGRRSLEKQQQHQMVSSKPGQGQPVAESRPQ